MSQNDKSQKKFSISKEINENLRKIWLLGLGITSAIEEKTVEFFDKYIEKGEKLLEKEKEKIRALLMPVWLDDPEDNLVTYLLY